jgi:hypothetical protein
LGWSACNVGPTTVETDDQAQQRTRLLCLIGMWSVPVFSMHGDEPGGIEDKLTYYCA